MSPFNYLVQIQPTDALFQTVNLLECRQSRTIKQALLAVLAILENIPG
jgi:hypothetical protein